MLEVYVVIFTAAILIVMFLYVFFYLKETKRQSKVDRIITSDDEKSADVTEVYENRKYKTNSVMLNSIPKWVCAAMVLITIIHVAGICYLYRTEGYVDGIVNISLVDLLSVGIGIIAIAVSAWVGLNVYISLSKEEVKDLGDRLQKYEQRIKQFDELDEYYKKNAWGEFHKLFTGSRYIIDEFFYYIFGERFDFSSIPSSIIFEMIFSEREFSHVEELYELDRYEDCILYYGEAVEHFARLEDKIRVCFESVSHLYDKLFFYIQCRKADLRFYSCVSYTRIGDKKVSIDDCEDVIIRWREIEKIFPKLKGEYERKDASAVMAYIYNTIGYMMDVRDTKGKGVSKTTIEDEKMQHMPTANEYMQKAINSLEDEGKWKATKARYLRNLGLTYERMQDRKLGYEQAKSAYNQSLQVDSGDYKSWNNAGNIEIKIMELELGIQKREDILPKINKDKLCEYHKNMIIAMRDLEISTSIQPSFRDPYTKLIQVYTYLLLIEGKNTSYMEKVEGYIRILEIKGNIDGLGELFAIRNYYEATGDIEYANSWNEQIGKNNGGNADYLNAKAIYEKYLK